MGELIENKVAKSGLINLNLEELKPDWKIMGFDISQALWQGLVLREKDFRAFVADFDWIKFENAHVFIHCSADAIVPTWAYMLLSTAMQPYATRVIFGSENDLKIALWREWIQKMNEEDYRDQRIIIKGCSDEEIDETIYVELTLKLMPLAKSLMFGEPCSTVPLFKRK